METFGNRKSASYEKHWQIQENDLETFQKITRSFHTPLLRGGNWKLLMLETPQLDSLVGQVDGNQNS